MVPASICMICHPTPPPPPHSHTHTQYVFTSVLVRRYNRAADHPVFNALLSSRSFNATVEGGDGFDMFEHPTRAVSLSLYSISKFVQLVSARGALSGLRLCLGGGAGELFWSGAALGAAVVVEAGAGLWLVCAGLQYPGIGA